VEARGYLVYTMVCQAYSVISQVYSTISQEMGPARNYLNCHALSSVCPPPFPCNPLISSSTPTAVEEGRWYFNVAKLSWQEHAFRQVLTTRPREEWRQDVALRYRALEQFSKEDSRVQFLRILRSMPYGIFPPPPQIICIRCMF